LTAPDVERDESGEQDGFQKIQAGGESWFHRRG
jgi:hypothetical protein